MSAVIDILLLTDQNSVVRSAECRNELLNSELRQQLRQWCDLPLSQIPDTEWALEKGQMHWKQLCFCLDIVPLTDAAQLLLLRQEDLQKRLMEAALNITTDGIELYDADAQILFLNQSCKKLLDLPADNSVEGQNLLDVFAVDPEYSTTLTALRTGAPVRRRFDLYKSTTGKDLFTVNTSYPVSEDGRLLGAVSVERSIQMTETLLSEVKQDQQLLTRRLSASMNKAPNIRYSLQDLIGSSPQLLSAIALAKKMAPRDNNILLQGETGTGKEIFAQGIHAISSRKNEKFVAVNCAAFPESLIEGMLFGTVKGAFTGSSDKAGLIEEADHGTLFLDELNSMSLGMQAKLLRVLQEKTLQRVGSTKDIPIDVRVISSCNEDVYQLMESGKLRKDLFYRLASIVIDIPPLRERMEDLDELVWHYVSTHEGLSAQPVTKIAPAFWQRLRHHSWPGNVRELFHFLNYAVSVSEGGMLREQDLPPYFQSLEHRVAAAPATGVPGAKDISFQKGLPLLLQEYERLVLQEAYNACGKNATKAAELLKISRQNFQYYVKKYNLKD